MGGLVAKLQVTSSADILWYSVANRPLSQIRATDEQRDYLFRLFYFEPLPFVTRVVFIGTPHNGSALASQSIGRLSSHLIQQPVERTIQHQILAKENPGVFSPEVQDRIPNSIDLLDPDSGILRVSNSSVRVQMSSCIRSSAPGFPGRWPALPTVSCQSPAPSIRMFRPRSLSTQHTASCTAIRNRSRRSCVFCAATRGKPPSRKRWLARWNHRVMLPHIAS